MESQKPRCQAASAAYARYFPCALEAGHPLPHMGRLFDDPEMPLIRINAGFHGCTGKFIPWPGDVATSAPRTTGPTLAR